LKGGDTNGDEKEGCRKQQEHEEIFTEEIFQKEHEEIRESAIICVPRGASIYSEHLAWPRTCDLTHQPASYRGLFSAPFPPPSGQSAGINIHRIIRLCVVAKNLYAT